MKPLDAPADTRIMAIVHSALRRDLLRAREVVAGQPAAAGRQRMAIGQHVTWLMEFLHAHHSAEDAGLWPLVRSRNPAAADLLDSLEGDHARIAPAADAVAEAALMYSATTTDEPRAVLVEAIDRLADVLFPHLDREVDEAMPVVSASITTREWDAVEQQFNIKPKSVRQLATEGHWLLEDIDPEGYDVVVGKVPPLKRFVLIHGFARGYRRQAAERWTPEVLPRPPS